MKTRIALLCLVFCFLFPTLPACTSFAVYGSEVWYGMNFDYPDTPIGFSFGDNGRHKVFRVLFGDRALVAGVNADGLFANFQLLYYGHMPADPKAGAPSLGIGDALFYALSNLSSVRAVREYVGDRALLQQYGLDLHSLYADLSGDAMALEPFGDRNGIATVKDGFLVVTNFPSSDFNGMDYRSVVGAGADRYQKAYEYINARKERFTLGDGIEVLKRTAQPAKNAYSTQVSLLIDPRVGVVYACFDGDFSKIWKISFKDETIEPYRGLSAAKPKKISKAGLWEKDIAPSKKK